MNPKQIEQLIIDLEEIGLQPDEIGYFLSAATDDGKREKIKNSICREEHEITFPYVHELPLWVHPLDSPTIH